MRFKLLIIYLLLISCASTSSLDNRSSYNSKGFALIYNEDDYIKKAIKIRLDNSKLQVAHNLLRANTLIKIINPKNKNTVIVKNIKKTNFPDFYKILITEKIATRLQIDKDLPLVEILEIKKNKSFVAEKAKIFNEEKKISSNAPVTSVQISNISKNKNKKKNKKENEIYILIASFYSEDTADFLKKRIAKELPQYNIRKLKIIKKKDTKINLISGPYYAVNLMKNDYIELKKFGFEELNIVLNE